MLGGNMREENLDERMERIRKRNEEIEKKHREAEADRMAALQANAMVKTTAPTDDEWPKEHKYDKLDFTYDVKTDNIDETNKKDETRLTRNFKKFPDGQGPPADPTYNFLADAERDGVTKTTVTNNSDADSKDWRASCTGGNLTRRINNNNSFNRGRNNNGGKGKNNNSVGKFQQPRNGDADPNLNSHLKKNDNRDNRNHKINDGKSRREWDNNKTSPDLLKINNQKKSTLNEFDKRSNKSGTNLLNRISAPAPVQQINAQPREFNVLPQKMTELNIEKRGNITVSVTQDGEVKSVKLEAARAIGTGRVGNGMTMRQNSQPLFNSGNQFNGTMRTPNSHPQVTVINNPMQTSLPAASVPKRSSVQDRLIVNRQQNQTDNSHVTINT